ncbi:MAG: energy transducer TonB [Chitinophagaceae bacterium]
MTNVNNRTKLLTGLAAIAIAASMASCANDTNSGDTVKTADAAMTDSTAVLPGDTTVVKPVAKMRKGRASAMVTMDNNLKIEKDKEGIYSRADKMPEYPGGEGALSKFVENNITYPQDAVDQDFEGTVNVSFVVDEKGKVINPVASGKMSGHGLDEEAVKIVKQMPAWKPGMVKGKAVKTRLLLPVTFKLADS